MYHACSGKVILPPKEDTFNADIMTGWWNPCKYFIGLKSRTDITPEFLKEIPQKRDCLFDWVKEKNPDIKEKHFNSFISFLEIVYTAGNLIPAPLNWKAGRSLDGWDYKLDNILNQKGSQGEQWYQYIVKNYNSEKPFECFIEKTTYKCIIIPIKSYHFGAKINQIHGVRQHLSNGLHILKMPQTVLLLEIKSF